MLKILSTAQIREIDRASISDYGIPETILMENAGIRSLKFLKKVYGTLTGMRVAVFCGKGNNGGDGFVIARHLLLSGVEVTVYLLSEQAALKGNARLNMEIFLKIGGRIKELVSEVDIKKHTIPLRHSDIYVDAMLGTGIASELKGIYLAAVRKINEWKKFVLAVDIPTGICSDKGTIYGDHVKADATITFGFPKKGMIFFPAAESVGTLECANISFPPELLESSPCEAFLLDGEWVSKFLGRPSPSAHKGNFGHAVVCGGSPGMGGAVGLASLSALKVGAGLSTAVVSPELSRLFELSIPEVMSFPLNGNYDEAYAESLLAFASGKSSLLIGPGMGKSGNVKGFVETVIKKSEVPLVIDADGLNAIAGSPDILKNSKAQVTVTPHPGEMGRLTGMSAAEVNEKRLEAAKEFSEKYGCVTVLKGARTVIASPGGIPRVNPTGNPNLASGGTGDVLAGMVAGFIARGIEPTDAATVAVYLHGLAADIYSVEVDDYSLSASDLVRNIGKAIAKVSSGS
ncbi:MAG: NAD(P)H-hydrate dehydratase [Nitrospinota bacterium]|nr:NAD(P)H-hydrate dehydratase [Nitrospinota bacterium]